MADPESHIPAPAERDQAARVIAAVVFAALGDETRLTLLSRLCEGRPRSLVELTGGTGLTRQGVAKHLGVLEQAGVVARSRVGRESRYAIRPESLTEARRYLETASRQWDEAIERLQRFVEG
ncbi:MAG: metalloregulator ArsR/SmtB family transcription factor [Thalassobaculaceae bacterium]|nr:metalloregulator ArsR/SmtB family transcription factor [Thalassobaculaceae bacterium]